MIGSTGLKLAVLANNTLQKWLVLGQEQGIHSGGGGGVGEMVETGKG